MWQSPGTSGLDMHSGAPGLAAADEGTDGGPPDGGAGRAMPNGDQTRRASLPQWEHGRDCAGGVVAHTSSLRSQAAHR